MPLPLEKKFIVEDCFALLSVEKPAIPERIRKAADNRSLAEKSEFHISVLASRNAKKVCGVISKNELPEKLKEEIASLFASFSWKYSLIEEYFLQENFYSKKELQELGHPELPEHTRKTIIQWIEMPDMKVFYEKLSDLFKIPLSLPVSHITLFSWSDYPPLMMRGIGISSEEDFKRYSKGRL